jgi:tRNA/tmRNA/rRNA uracil-C5-methylase (TrmA/RlmC/RlmD family)
LLQVDAEGRIGAFAAHSHTVVPVSGLPLVAEDLVEALGALEAEIPAAGPLDVSRLRLTPSTQVRLARDEGGPNRVVVGDPRSTPAGRPVTRTAAGHRFEVAVDGFWQVHERAPEVLSAAVRAAVPAGRFRSALDLYGGVGLFAAVLAESIQRVETVEADRTASGLARRNLRDTEVRVSQGRVDRVLAQYSEQRARWATGGAAVLDPPRSGAGRGVLRQLAELRLGRIVYVACDPVALARDTRTLLGLGYEMGEVRALDLFPHSHHFEVVAIFDR